MPRPEWRKRGWFDRYDATRITRHDVEPSGTPRNLSPFEGGVSVSKQFLFLVGLTVLGTAGPFLLSPVVGLGVYYFLAVLRPNFWWGWALPDPDMGWSRYVALGTLLATALWRAGMFAPFRAGRTPWYGEPTYTRSHYLFLLFVGWISLTYPTAQNTDRGGLYFEEYVKIFMMFICGTLILRRVQDLWLIYFVVLAAVVYIGYEGNMYYFFNNRFNIFQRYEAAGQDNNWVGLTLAMVVPMCYFAWEAVRHWVRWKLPAHDSGRHALHHAVVLSRGDALALRGCRDHLAASTEQGIRHDGVRAIVRRGPRPRRQGDPGSVLLHQQVRDR